VKNYLENSILQKYLYFFIDTCSFKKYCDNDTFKICSKDKIVSCILKVQDSIMHNTDSWFVYDLL